MKKYDFEEFFSDLLSVILFGSFGIIVTSQFTNLLTLQFICGIVFILIMKTKSNYWGLVDLLLLRRLIVFVGLVTLFSSVITGAVTLGIYTGIPVETYLSLEIKTWPVYLSMSITAIIVSAYRFLRNIQQATN